VRLWTSLVKIGIGASLGVAATCFAMPETDDIAICYGVGADDKQTFKTPCTVTNTGGGGSIVTIYQIKDKQYTVVSESSGDWLNEQPYTSYTRGAFFERLQY
jgi:hypothetical protein